MKYEKLRNILHNSEYLVCLCGIQTSELNGYPALWDGDKAYDIEDAYGYSTEEIFNSSFFATRTELFFDFYRKEIIANLPEPNEVFQALAQLERQGVLRTTITREIYDLPRRAGCEQVINLHGTIYKNRCSRCGREYPIDAMHQQGLPLCDNCNTVIRPGICLYGEMVDNTLSSQASHEVAKADTLLVLGARLNSGLSEKFLQYFSGKKLVLVAREEHYKDHLADIAIYGDMREIMGAVAE